MIRLLDHSDPDGPGEDGRGLGASHQTGWTALEANILERVAAAREARERRAP